MVIGSCKNKIKQEINRKPERIIIFIQVFGFICLHRYFYVDFITLSVELSKIVFYKIQHI